MRGSVYRTGDERGSALVISMVLILLMTLLGLALLDLGALENRMAASSQLDARAFETAQAGIERGMRELLNAYLSDTPGAESWADGTPACGGACTASQYRAVALSNATLPGAGTYAVEVKLLTGNEAAGAPYGQACSLVTPGDPNSLCKDLAFVRATGTVSGSAGGGGAPDYTAARTIQVLARATSGSAVLNGIVAGTPGGQSMQGNVRIAGTINILGDVSGAVPALAFTGDAGQRNNWADLDGPSLSRLTPLPLVCPPGRTCASPCTTADCVESLGAQLLIARPTSIPAVDLGGAAALGQPGDSGSYGAPARKGKGPLDGAFVADGCVMPCTDNYTGGSSVYSDNGITKPYPANPPPPFPLLTDPVQIGGTQYNHFACPNPVGSCNPANAYMNTHAANFTTDLSGTTGSASGLRDNTASFQTAVRTFTNRSGATRWGQICWNTGTELLTFAVYAVNPGANPMCAPIGGSMSPACPAGVPSCPLDPLLVYLDDGFKIERQGGPTEMSYAGAAVITTTGGAAAAEPVKIEETFQSLCGAAPCTGERFPENNALSILTFANMELGKDTANIDRIMGYFYTQQDFVAQKQTNIVGGVASYRFCFGGGCGFPGGNVPRVFHVPADPRLLPEELSAVGGGRRWSVGYVPRFWLVCRPGTLPSTPTGICGY
jgi:hypothetical protein